MSLSIILRVAIAIAVAAGEQCLHNDLALLQTIIQVDGGEVSTDAGAVASSRPVAKLHACPFVSKTLVGIAVLVLCAVGNQFHYRIYEKGRAQAVGKDDGIKDRLAEERAAGNNGGRSPATAEATPAKPESEQRMSWAVFLLGICFMMLECFATDQYVPQMPEMADEMGCTQTQMGVTLQINWLLKAIMAIIGGAVSDRVGRRPVIILGTFLLSVSSFACAGCDNIMWFYAARAIQGIGEGAEGVVRSTYRDTYDDVKKRVRIGSCSLVVMSLAPIVAPSVGGIITEHTGSWRSSFILFGGIGAVLAVLLGMFFDETMPARKEGEQQTSVKQDIIRVINDFHLVMILTLTTLVGVIGMLGASSNAFIFENIYHRSPLFYARMTALNAVVGVIGIGFAQFFLHLNPIWVMRISFTLTGITSAIIIPMACSSLIHSVWFFIACPWISIVVGIPAGMAMGPLYLEQMKHSSGIAGGLQTMFTNLFGAIITHGLSYIVAPNGATGMLLTASGVGVFTVVLFWIGFGWNPPSWACEKPKADGDGAEAAMGH